MRTAFSHEPVAVQLDGLRDLAFPSDASASEQASTHLIEQGGFQMHGALAAAGTALGWQPVGSDDAIPLAADKPLRITRISKPAEKPNGTRPVEDILYLRNGDQVPCRVLSVDDDAVIIASSICESHRIPQTAVKAIEFNADAAGSVYGFGDSRWRVVPLENNAVEQTQERIVLRGGAELSHPSLVPGDVLEFDLEWNRSQQCHVSISFFATNVAGDQSPSFFLILNGDQIQVLTSNGQGGVRRFAQSNVMQLDPGQEARKRFSLQAVGNEIQLLVDGTVLGTQPFPKRRLQGRGIHLSVQSVNARRQLRRMPPANGQPGPDFLMAISNLQSSRGSAVLGRLAIAEQDRVQLLTVPRSRRHNPPRQILVAKNDDLLRGELVALDPQTALFRSRLEEIAVPRDRLSGIVWLEFAEQSEHGPMPRGNVQVTFTNGAVLRVSPENVVGRELLGRHGVLGTCRLSLEDVNEMRMGELASRDPDAELRNLDAAQCQGAGHPLAGGRRSELRHVFHTRRKTGGGFHAGTSGGRTVPPQ